LQRQVSVFRKCNVQRHPSTSTTVLVLR